MMMQADHHFEAILFDCDGVLVDSEIIATQALHRSLQQLRLNYSEADVAQQFTGHSFPACIAMIEQELGASVPQWFLDENTRIFNQLMHEQLIPMPGIEAVLQQLALPFAVVTNSRSAELTMKLSVTGLDKYFPELRRFDSQSMGVAKPDPAIYRQSAEALGYDIKRCLVIEDSAPGLTAASHAGATVWAYRPHVDAATLQRLSVHDTLNHWHEFHPRLQVVA